MPRGLSAHDVAQIWSVPLARVYRLANAHRWRRYREGRLTFYHPDDVATTMDAVQPEETESGG
ncbi:hypothetical protein LV75_001897 [Actinokineospora diospyrosa]|uniref:Helix-turn-helix protein n=1 Tax=Actinokineospora diospyrosa TaxID=103728 RepID=A0ABT1I9V4_9PSEU|nr:hypothetical protein [Actinokineospora diospyrosa]